jgi:hypothetical protein
MAQKTIVTYECDLHDDGTTGDETLSFAFDGTSYEIDACATHAKDLRKRFDDIIPHARRTTMGRSQARPRRTAASRDHNTDVRAWAKQNGHQVSERGRIPAAVIAEYESAH